MVDELDRRRSRRRSLPPERRDRPSDDGASASDLRRFEAAFVAGPRSRRGRRGYWARGRPRGGVERVIAAGFAVWPYARARRRSTSRAARSDRTATLVRAALGRDPRCSTSSRRSPRRRSMIALRPRCSARAGSPRLGGAGGRCSRRAGFPWSATAAAMWRSSASRRRRRDAGPRLQVPRSTPPDLRASSSRPWSPSGCGSQDRPQSSLSAETSARVFLKSGLALPTDAPG